MVINPRLKLIITITGLIVALGVLLVFIYFLLIRPFVKPASNANTPANTNASLPGTNVNVNRTVSNLNGSTSLPTFGQAPTGTSSNPTAIAQGGYTKTDALVSNESRGATLSSDGSSVVYYDVKDGKFYRIDSNGNKELMSEETFVGVDNIIWSNDKSRAVIIYPDGSKISYDFNAKKAYSLPREAQDFEFSKDGRKIAYKFVGEDESERWLAIASPDGTQQQIVEEIGDKANKVEVAWSPTGQVVAFYRSSLSADEEEILPIGQFGENFKSFAVSGTGFNGLWSPSGDHLLYSVSNSDSDYNPQLYVTLAQGAEVAGKQQLQLSTWSDKCAFSGDSTVYCAVPQSLPEGAGLYPDLAASIPDQIYRVDLTNGTKTLLALPTSASGQTNFTAKNLFVADDESTLYFTDLATGTVQKIRLK